MCACALSMLYSVPFRPLVINWATCPCIDLNSLVGPTDPCECLLWTDLKGGTYQMSDAFVKAGTVTVFYS